MISYRPDLTVTKLLFRTKNVELKHVQIAPLKNLKMQGTGAVR